MKKGIVAAVLSLMVVSSSLMVEAHHGQQMCGAGGCYLGECFTHFDEDGYCGDHYFVDENGDGVCDNHCYYDGNGDNICDYFIDDNEDGICDHCHDHGKPVVVRRSTTRRSRGHHGCHGGC